MPRSRNLSSFRKEAAASLRGRWKEAISATCILTLIMLLPASALIFGLSKAPLSQVIYFEASEISRFYMKLYSYIGAALLVSFLLSPLQIVAQSRLSVNLFFDKPIDLPSLSASPREWLKSLRVSLMQLICALWPAAAGAAAMAAAFCLPASSLGLAALSIAGFIALTIYSLLRYFSYIPAQYFLILFPEDNARALLRKSRRFMKGYTGQLIGLVIRFFGWSILCLLLPILLRLLPGGLVHPQILTIIIYAATILCSLPLAVYANATIAAFILGLPCDQ